MARRLLPLALTVLVTACAGGPDPATAPSLGWSQTGVASWYGPGFHGRPTASGEPYDMDGLTAAHRFLPFDTRLRVTNVDNGRSIDVRINDRGPFVDGRVLDVSRAAARALGMLGPGTARVRLVVVGTSGLLECSRVQVGAFAEVGNAAALEAQLRAAGEPAHSERGLDGLTRVLLGPYEKVSEAQLARRRYRGLLRPCSGVAGSLPDEKPR